MPITEKQRQRRRDHLGASDMAAVMGVSPYRNAWTIWAEKTGRLEEHDPEWSFQVDAQQEQAEQSLPAHETGRKI